MINSFNFEGYDPAVLLRRRQPVRTAMLETILIQHGFQKESHKGSHIKFEHKKFKLSIVIVAGSTDLSYQHNVAKICQQVRETAAEARKNLIEDSQAHLSAENDLSNNAADEIYLTADYALEVAEVIPVTEFKDSIILQMKACPQIGLIAPTHITKVTLDALLLRMKKESAEFLQELENATNKYGINVVWLPDKTLYLRQSDYRYDDSIPAFGLGNTKHPRDQLNEIIGSCAAFDEHIAGSVKAFFENIQIATSVSSTSGPHGLIHWTFEKRDSFAGGKIMLSLDTTPEYRVCQLNWLIFQDQIFRFDFYGNGDPKYFGEVLYHYHGFNVRRPSQGKLPGKELVCSHPFYPDCKFTIPFPGDLPQLADLFEIYTRATNQDQKVEAENNLWEIANKRNEIYNVMETVMNIFLMQKKVVFEKLSALQINMRKITGLNQENNNQQVGAGGQFYIRFSHASWERPIYVRCIKLLDTKKEEKKFIPRPVLNQLMNMQHRKPYMYMPHPDDIDALEKALEPLLPAKAALGSTTILPTKPVTPPRSLSLPDFTKR